MSRKVASISLANPGARLATWCVAGAVRHALQGAGFQVERKPGFGHKKERLEAQFAQPSRFTPHPPPSKTAAIIGAARSSSTAVWAGGADNTTAW